MKLQKQLTRSCLVAMSLAAMAGTAQAELTWNGIASARVGTIQRDGMAPGFDEGFTNLTGNLTLFADGSRNLGKGYRAGFGCVTVATTASGAMAGFANGTLPVTHAWHDVFAGQEDFGSNGPVGGGFASYGNLAGDDRGVLCNDEVKVYLATPYGTVAVGHIMNPLRAIYDNATVDPFYTNQHTYYQGADIRGNALRYGHAIEDFTIDLQLNMPSSGTLANEANEYDGTAWTGLLGYTLGNNEFGLGFGAFDAAWSGTRFVTHDGAGAFDSALGGYWKTSIGPVGFAISALNAVVENTSADGGDLRDISDVNVKFSYPHGKWNFIAIVGKETEKADFRGYGDPFTFKDAGVSVARVDTDRTNIDLWAQYDMTKGTKTYVRFNRIEKEWTSPDNAALKEEAEASTLEVGVIVNF